MAAERMEFAARKVRHLVADVAVDEVGRVQFMLLEPFRTRERHANVVGDGLHHVVVGLAFLHDGGDVGALQRVLRPALGLADEHELGSLGPVVLRVRHRYLPDEDGGHVLVGVPCAEDDRAPGVNDFLDGVVVRVVNGEGGGILVVFRRARDVELVVEPVH